MRIKDLQDKYKGKMGFVVGSGPSLHFQDVSKMMNYPVICVNSSILKFAQKNKDLYFLADDWSVKTWSYFYELSNINCINLLYKEKLEKYSKHLDENKIIWFNHKTWYNVEKREYPKDGLFLTKDVELPIIGARTAVGSAIHFAYIMGYDPIVVTGIDCSYRDGKKYYWQYNNEPQVYLMENKNSKIICNSINNQDVHTLEFIKYFIQLSEQTKKQNINIIDVSGGVLKCFNKMKYDEVFERYGEKNEKC
jgi:hypothetical protein